MSKNEVEEIEISPEMYEAGANQIRGYDSRFQSPEGAAEAVFSAMLELLPQEQLRALLR